MNGRDITEKKLIDFTDVFADIINVLIFDGENQIDGSQLQYALPRSIYKIKGEISEQERDAAKYWRDNTTCFALIGVENQTQAEKHFPLRVISYDGSDYRAQIRHWDDVKRKNAKEVLELMSALTGDHAFEEAYNETLKGGSIPVRTIIDFERDKSEKIGIEKGEEKFAHLVSLLISNGRSDEVARAASDKEYRESLYKQYAIL